MAHENNQHRSVVIVAVLGRSASAEPVDLSRPFQVDKDTICLFHLDDPAGGEVRDAVREGSLEGAATSAGRRKVPGALNCEADKGRADVTDLTEMEGIEALTVECWVKFRDRAAGDGFAVAANT